MSLLLTLEHAPHLQSRQEFQHESGDLTIGRGAEANWQLDDPDMLVSRFHCVISGGNGEYYVTDSSRGGLFIDGSNIALGAGNSAKLEDGSRLRLGDYVLRVHLAAAPAKAATPSPAASAGNRPNQIGFGGDDFFSVRTPAPEAKVRPADLPNPFDAPAKSGQASAPNVTERPAPPLFDDPFTLDPVPSRPARPIAPQSEIAPQPAQADVFAFESQPRPMQQSPAQSFPERTTSTTPTPELREAFFKGMGLKSSDFETADALAQMQALGARYRMLAEGLVQLLRNRAQEKQNARVAQTIIGHSEVNPLKFLATIDDILSALVRDKNPGYMSPDAAVNAAFRDLAEHNINSWNAVQTALRRMIDRFDPKSLEDEMKDKSTLETLLAGGKRAKLWQLYEERYQQIARSAEDRFLGEVGADFRDAYEKNKGERK